MDATKPILFYSNECQHSNKLLESINNTSFINNITLCSVDDLSITIPDFIQSVPTIYIPNQQRILTDNGLIMYINTELSKSSRFQPPPQQPPHQQPPQSQPPQQKTPMNSSEDIMAYHKNEMSSDFSDSYSFIEEDSKESNGFTHNYTFLEDEKKDNQPTTNNIQSPPNIQMAIPQMSNNKSSKGDMLDKAYEDLMNSRNKDFIPMAQQRI